jgi:hypothetical protein
MQRHSEKSSRSCQEASPDGWNTPTGITWYIPPAWPTLAGSRQCSRNEARPVAASNRSVSVVMARLAGRRLRSHGSAIRARGLAGRCPPSSRAAAYSCAAASPVSTPSK